MHPVQSIGYAAAYPAYPLNPPLTDGTLDVRTLWLSDSATRIGIARGRGGEGAEGSNPTLPPRGQLTRCFSAVAELLVIRRSYCTQYNRPYGMIMSSVCLSVMLCILTKRYILQLKCLNIQQGNRNWNCSFTNTILPLSTQSLRLSPQTPDS